jgi:hypothetical protein
MRFRPSLHLAGLLLFAALPALSGCGDEPGPPPKVARESAGAQVQRVAKQWGDTVEEEGFLENDPNGVLEFQVVTTRKLTLGEGTAAAMHIERDETFHTKLGLFRCKVKGDLNGTARYAWQGGDAEVRVDLPAASLPRSCETPGFPVTAKSLGDTTMVMVLKSDRLIGKTSARDRTVLLPLQ